MYSGYGITFDSEDWWSCCNGTSRNVIAFGVDSSTSSHAENCKTNFLILDFGPTFGINGSFGSPEQKSCIHFTKANPAFCWSLHYNTDNSYLLDNEKEIFKFKADNKNVNFPTQCCLGRISDEFSATRLSIRSTQKYL